MVCSCRHLDCFVNIEAESRGVADQEYDDDGEEEGHHGCVPAMCGGHCVVKSGVAEIVQTLKTVQMMHVLSHFR